MNRPIRSFLAIATIAALAACSSAEPAASADITPVTQLRGADLVPEAGAMRAEYEAHAAARTGTLTPGL